MGDTIDQDSLLKRSFSGTWARAACAAVVVVATGCQGSDSLVVTVNHPTSPSLPINSTTISVYVSSNFTCQDIEYGDVDSSALLAAQVASETISGTTVTGNLDSLPRTASKMIVALGLDDTGSLLAGGCVTVGTVSGTLQVAIATEVAATLSLSLVNASGSGSAEPYQIQAIITQPDGALLANRQVWWRVYGPPGSVPTATTDITANDNVWEPAMPSCTGSGSASSGIAFLDPVPPSLIGGFEVEVRVAWGVEPPQYVPEFTVLGSALSDSGSSSGDLQVIEPPSSVSNNHVCTRSAMAGSASGVVCLTGSATAEAQLYAVTVNSGVASLANSGAPDVLSPKLPVALYGVDVGSSHEVFAVNSDCSLDSVYGSVPPTNVGGPCASADDAIVVPACGSATPKLWIHYAGVDRDLVRQIDLGDPSAPATDFALTGANVSTGTGSQMSSMTTTIAFNSVGCITELDPGGVALPQLQQVGVFDETTIDVVLGAVGTPTNDTKLVGNCGSGLAKPCPLSVDLPVALGGTGYVSASNEQRLVATTDSAQGVQLFESVLLAGSNALIERSAQPTEAEPSLVVAGTFDPSGVQDLVWTEDFKRGTSFQVSYPFIVNGEPLSASSAAAPLKALAMEEGSFDGTTNTQIAVYGEGLGSTMTKVVFVIPTGVPPETVTLPTDATCGP
jgi:hypothetical protein